MEEAVLKLENLTKTYGNERGAIDISFELQEGEVFGLLGSNGAGKTTIMKVISGLSHSNSGCAKIFGVDVELDRESALKEVGTLIENPAFYGYMSAIDNMKIASRYYAHKQITARDCENTLDRVGLGAYKNDKASKYSLGMKQRLGLALTMISKPKLYILDEPSNGLDIDGRVEIRSIISELSKEKEATFIICSHISDEIQRLCSKVGIMKNGRLIEIQTMENILDNYPSLEEYYIDTIKNDRGFKI